MTDYSAYTTDKPLTDVSRRSVIGGLSAATLGLALGVPLAGRALAQTAAPKPGGVFRFACLDGSPANTLEAGIVNSWTEIACQSALYDPLFDIGPDGAPRLRALASAEPNSDAKLWTLRLHPITFHDGRAATAEDLAFSLTRIVDPASPKAGAAALATMDAANIKPVGELAVEVPFTAPFSLLPDIMSVFWNFGLVPTDYDPAAPVGSGPFTLKSYQPGQVAEFERFDGYWDGPAHLDGLMMINLTDESAAYNALQGGQIDAISSTSFNLAKQVGDSGAIRALISEPAQNIVLTMRADTAPFDDPDVRMAMKLIVDREQMVKLAIAGYGQVANDLFSPFDPLYDDSLTRTQDIETAKELLAKAGHPDLTVELVTAPAIGGMVEQAQIFAQQARKAGVTVNINQVTADLYTTKYYAQSSFSQDYFGYFPFFAQIAQSMLPGAGANTTYWEDAEFLALYDEAQRTVDPTAKAEIAKKMQAIEFDRGAYIVPMGASTIDLVSDKVMGLDPSQIGYTLGDFAFTKIWLA